MIMKKQMSILKLLSIAVLLFGFTACDMMQDEVAPRDQKSGFQYKVVMNPEDEATGNSTARVQSNHLDFTAGTLMVKEVEFEAKSDYEKIEFKRNHETTIDLITGEADPPFPLIELQAGTYNKIEFGVKTDEDTDGPALLIEGTFTNSDGEEIPFKFEFDKEVEFEVELKDSVKIDSAQTTLALIELIPSRWFENVSQEALDSAELDSAGTLVINDTTNTEIYTDLFKGVVSQKNVDCHIWPDFDDDDWKEDRKGWGMPPWVRDMVEEKRNGGKGHGKGGWDDDDDNEEDEKEDDDDDDEEDDDDEDEKTS